MADITLTMLNRAIAAAKDFVGAMKAIGIPLAQSSVACECTSYLAMWEMFRQGLGVGLIDVHIGDTDPSIDRAAPSQPGLPFPIWLTAHRDILTNKRLRLVFDFLIEALATRKLG
ncbi:MAG: substrate-binding domain-containing protein [Rhodobacteraceae bacterium]|nr:substrate-binding domain-containing protein [Paracoccaceae bacterium]